MQFQDIGSDENVNNGEYLFHKPSEHLVLVGRYDPKSRTVMAMVNGRLINEKLDNFQRVFFTKAEHVQWRGTKCSGCKKLS